jgi:RNA polymerase sigma-70 factor (ECF subfamily)
MITGPLTLNTIAGEIQEDEDLLYIERVLAGEASAFTPLMTKYRRLVYAIAYRYTGNHEEANDLAQETFIKAYNNLSRFRGEASFKTWLLRIVNNLSINVKKSGRVSKDSGHVPEDFEEASDPQALNQVMTTQRNAKLYAAIAQLPPKQKQALMLKTFEDMTCEQVAQAMNCSPGTVKANVFNAVKKLKGLLAEAFS